MQAQGCPPPPSAGPAAPQASPSLTAAHRAGTRRASRWCGSACAAAGPPCSWRRSCTGCTGGAAGSSAAPCGPAGGRGGAAQHRRLLTHQTCAHGLVPPRWLHHEATQPSPCSPSGHPCEMYWLKEGPLKVTPSPDTRGSAGPPTQSCVRIQHTGRSENWSFSGWSPRNLPRVSPAASWYHPFAPANPAQPSPPGSPPSTPSPRDSFPVCACCVHSGDTVWCQSSPGVSPYQTETPESWGLAESPLSPVGSGRSGLEGAQSSFVTQTGSSRGTGHLPGPQATGER